MCWISVSLTCVACVGCGETGEQQHEGQGQRVSVPVPVRVSGRGPVLVRVPARGHRARLHYLCCCHRRRHPAAPHPTACQAVEGGPLSLNLPQGRGKGGRGEGYATWSITGLWTFRDKLCPFT